MSAICNVVCARRLQNAVPVLINAINGARASTPLERAAETLIAARGDTQYPSGTSTTTTLGAAIPSPTTRPVRSPAPISKASSPAQAPIAPAAPASQPSGTSNSPPSGLVINQGVQVSSDGITLSGNGGGSGIRVGTDGITYNAGAGQVDVQQLAAVASALSSLAAASGVSNVHVGMDGVVLNRGSPGEIKVSVWTSRSKTLT
jgi:hypothetical protein